MSDTLGSLRAEITNWLRGDLIDVDGQNLINICINDAIEDIWLSMMRVALARFIGLDSPVTFTLPSGAERVQLITINDPTVAPTTGFQSGGALPMRTLLVGYTYVTESGSETQLSPTASQIVPANNLGQITPPAQVAGAFGWNCYISVTNTQAFMALQNQQPLSFNPAALFVEPTSGWQDYSVAQQQPPVAQIASQATPAQSPPPSENTTSDGISYITHMEIRSNNGGLLAWGQHDITSEVFRRYGRTQASSSEYQTYVWDLLNGNRLEIRPTTAAAFSPRYFYIARPRRLRYDPAEIPYVSITGVHEFIVNKAIGKLKLGIDEYISSTAWLGAAETSRQNILLALTQESWTKNDNIVPYLF